MPLSEIRIIGGIWRSRKIRFPQTPTLRPTPDRVRETLFNWLAPTIQGARCIDLFAGTGVLGFEALSRGAACVISIEKDRHAIAALQDNAKLLEAHAMQIIQADALRWLESQTRVQAQTQEPAIEAEPLKFFDIAFVDPPYALELLPSCLKALEPLLTHHALIYFEHNAAIDETIIPTNFALLRQKKAGQVYYYLARKIH